MLDTVVDISGIAKDNIPIVWEDVAPLVEEGLEYSEGGFGVDDIYSLLLQGKQQLWLATEGREVRGCAVTELVNYPQRMACLIVLVAGIEFEKWSAMADLIEYWAGERGAQFMLAYGRKGWQKRMHSFGYTTQSVVYTKSLKSCMN